MKKIFNLTTGYILTALGLSIILFSLCLTINNLDNENNNLKRIIEEQGNSLIKCNSENNNLYDNYIKLEEQNMILENKLKNNTGGDK